jgi:hypothetical protein
MLVSTLGTFRNPRKITEIRGTTGQDGIRILSVKSITFYHLKKVLKGNFLGGFTFSKFLKKLGLDFSSRPGKFVVCVPLIPRLHRLPYYPNF